MEVYVMRHGTTVWNEKFIIQGRTHNMLSKSGKLLVEKQAENFKNEKIDLIICSPMRRTVQTANIMNKYHNVKIVKDDRIIEVDQGIFTARRKNSLSDEEKAIKNARNENFGLESYRSVFERCENFIETLKSNYSDKKVLVITHNIVATYLERLQQHSYYSDEIYSNKMSFDNAEVKKLQF